MKIKLQDILYQKHTYTLLINAFISICGCVTFNALN